MPRRPDDFRNASISQDHAQLLLATLEQVRDQAKTIRAGLNGTEGTGSILKQAGQQLAALILGADRVLGAILKASQADDLSPVPERPTPYDYGDDRDAILTLRQKQILAYLRDHIATRGYPPTFREIGLAMGIGSPNGVNCHLKVLQKKGFLTRTKNRSRAIQLT